MKWTPEKVYAIILSVSLRVYYGASMAGYSIPATEHRSVRQLVTHGLPTLAELVDYVMHMYYSTITSWTKEREADAFKNMLEKVTNRYVQVHIIAICIACCVIYFNMSCAIVSQWCCGLCQ